MSDALDNDIAALLKTVLDKGTTAVDVADCDITLLNDVSDVLGGELLIVTVALDTVTT